MNRPDYTIPQEYLSRIKEETKNFWPLSKTFIISGATGFFGRWILEAALLLDQSLGVRNKYILISRQPSEKLKEQRGYLRKENIKIIDPSLVVNEISRVDYVIDAATDVRAAKLQENICFDDLNKLTESLLQLSSRSSAIKYLYLSSGAVYAPNDYFLSEESNLITEGSPYADHKIKSENKILNFCQQNNLDFIVARCFSFIGPYLAPEMAISQFIHSKKRGLNIEVGSPDAYRSYLDMSDAITALFTLLFNRTMKNIYNIGSEESYNMIEIANKINELEYNASKVKVTDNYFFSLAGRYYAPSMKNFNLEFSTIKFKNLDTALQHMYNFIGGAGS